MRLLVMLGLLGSIVMPAHAGNAREQIREGKQRIKAMTKAYVSYGRAAEWQAQNHAAFKRDREKTPFRMDLVYLVSEKRGAALHVLKTAGHATTPAQLDAGFHLAVKQEKAQMRQLRKAGR